MQNRRNYAILKYNVGPTMTRRVHQEQGDQLYFDVNDATCTSEQGCNGHSFRLEFHCGLTRFIQNVQTFHSAETIG